MHLIYIYGPPAAGKKTIAEKLSEITGIPLFHNHMTVNISSSIFTFGTSNYFRLVDFIRMNTIMECQRIGLKALIFTNAYTPEKNGKFVKELKEKIAKRHGIISFVKLDCSREALLSRVANSDRLNQGKITDPDLLEKILSKDDFLTRIPYTPHYEYNNNNETPSSIAQQIILDLDLVKWVI